MKDTGLKIHPVVILGQGTEDFCFIEQFDRRKRPPLSIPAR